MHIFIFNHLVPQKQQLFWPMCLNIWHSSGAVCHMYRNTWTLLMNLWSLCRYGNFSHDFHNINVSLCMLGYDFLFYSSTSLVLSFLWPNSSFSAFSFFFSFRMSQQLKEWNYSPRKQSVEAVDSLSEELRTVKTQISQVGDEWLELSCS